MIKFFYKRIIRRLNLSRDQLRELKSRLVPERICSGPFFTKTKMCPTTTGLALKLNVHGFSSKEEIYREFAKFGNTKMDFYLLYLVFDLPAVFSDRFFRYSLRTMREAIDELATYPPYGK